jgi:hypothetical protein
LGSLLDHVGSLEGAHQLLAPPTGASYLVTLGRLLSFDLFRDVIMGASSKRFVRERGLSHNRGAKALLSVKPEDILSFWALFRKVSNKARGVGAFSAPRL